ncbi:hypothetical protein IK110_00060 [Candidatus Saccharibacteria bacterium]|nr:hypothetical protein [Candidatus Saccharibacteria bacterium]
MEDVTYKRKIFGLKSEKGCDPRIIALLDKVAEQVLPTIQVDSAACVLSFLVLDDLEKMWMVHYASKDEYFPDEFNCNYMYQSTGMTITRRRSFENGSITVSKENVGIKIFCYDANVIEWKSSYYSSMKAPALKDGFTLKERNAIFDRCMDIIEFAEKILYLSVFLSETFTFGCIPAPITRDTVKLQELINWHKQMTRPKKDLEEDDEENALGGA